MISKAVTTYCWSVLASTASSQSEKSSGSCGSRASWWASVTMLAKMTEILGAISATSSWLFNQLAKSSKYSCEVGTCGALPGAGCRRARSEEHTSELQSRGHLV